MATDYDVIIIGSGVAGSLLAYKLAGRYKVLILEAGDNKNDYKDPKNNEVLRQQWVENFAVLKDKTPITPYLKDADNLKKFAFSPDLGDFSLFDPLKKQFFVQTGPEVFKSQYLRLDGGSTQTWRGNSPRFVPGDFNMKSRYGVAEDWPISYSDVEPYYCDAEDELGVSGNGKEWDQLFPEGKRSRPYPMKGIVQAYGDTQIINHLKKKPVSVKLTSENGKVTENIPIKITATPQARNSEKYDGRSACQGNHNCLPVCPSHAKYDASIHIGKFLDVEKKKKLDSTIIFKAVVTKLNENPVTKDIESVSYMSWDKADPKPSDTPVTVTARIIVVAANAIESAKLLLMSKVGNRSDEVGRNLMDHPGGEGCALLPFPVFPFRGPQSTSGIEVFREGNFRKDHCAFRITVGNDGWGRTQHPFDVLERLITKQNLYGKTLNDKLSDIITRQFRFSYSTDMLPNRDNRVSLSAYKDDYGIPKPQLSFRVDDYCKKGMEVAQSVCKKMFTALGAGQDSWIFTDLKNPEKFFSGSGHIMGTAKMGKDWRTSVVDAECRSHDHKNLFIVGSSVFTTGSSANPTITIAALSLRAADSIAKQLK